MCLALPGKVVKIQGLKAMVKTAGNIKWVLVGEKDVKVGDLVAIQMGVIIEILPKKDLIVFP